MPESKRIDVSDILRVVTTGLGHIAINTKDELLILDLSEADYDIRSAADRLIEMQEKLRGGDDGM